MKRYEYLNVTFQPRDFARENGPEQCTRFCNEYGERGWEMVNFFYVYETNLMCFMFKREKSEY